MQSESNEATVPPIKKKADKSELSENVSVRVDKIESSKKSDSEDPKPRIVLTFRSEKPGAKSSMKIVSNEEKQEEVSPRRTRNRAATKWDSDDDALVSPKKDRSKSQPVSENEEVSDSSNTNLKRSTRHTTVAKKEKAYNEAAASSTPTQRLSRRIKPTAKILANEELRIGLESQNNARLAISSEKSPEEGVRTRRSARRRSVDILIEEAAETIPKTRAAKRGLRQPVDEDHTVEEGNPGKEKKLKHLCELGLKEKSPDEVDDVEVIEDREEEPEVIDDEEDDEELDDDTEVINKLLEAEQESQASETTETSDDDYLDAPAQQRSAKKAAPRRRSSRKPPKEWAVDVEEETAASDDVVAPASEEAAEAGRPPACPEDENQVIATCFCQTETNMYPAPEELEEPVFCQAIESVNGVHVGCSHAARGGPLARAGPRAPYVLVCRLHRHLLWNHMCCPACGLFCTQGTFYQCSLGHLFHLECGVPYSDTKHSPGCPHCGFYSYQWQPVNRTTSMVKVQMNTSNKRIYLPAQRIQCTPSYLTFSKLPPSQMQREPVIPPDLLAITPEAIKALLEQQVQELGPDDDEEAALERLCDAIDARESIEQIVSKIYKGMDLNRALDSQQGGTALHAAARAGHAAAALALSAAGAALDRADRARNTPLLVAIHEICDKQEKKEVKTILKQKKMLKINGDTDTIKPEQTADTVDMEKSEIADVKEEPMNTVAVGDKTEATTSNIVGHINEEVDLDTKEFSKIEIDHTSLKEATVEVKVENVTEELERTEIDDEKEDLLDDDSDTEMKEKEIDSASEEDLIKVIKFLIAAGCDVNCASAEGLTALHVGASQPAACRALLAAPRLQLDARDLGGWTPLVWRLEHDDAPAVKMLLEHGAAADPVDLEGNSAVHWAALHGAAHCLQLLLAHTPDLHAALNTHTDTPLHIAARQGHYACVVILLARGARTDVENCEGELPVDVCYADCQVAISLNMKLNRYKQDRDSKTRILSHDISNGREEYPVPCINSVDDATLPADFVYVTQHVMPTNIVIDNSLDTLQGCTCTGPCDAETCACVRLGVRAWWARGRLRPDFPYHEPPMLFDCNHSCRCNPKLCPNQQLTRSMARGSQLAPAQVYRAGGARGWGVRAAAGVARGAAVATYCGELLALPDADSRTDDHYMFALDVKPDLLEQCREKTLLCIDAGKFGSTARFMNHSCCPNLAPVRAYTACRDLRLPTVALHAVRDIQPMEPFTFDYGDKFWSVKNKWMKCECGTPECRYPTIATEEND